MEQVGDGRGGGELRGDENKQHHPRPPPQQQCPRCESLDTKFSYYNNYSLLQPRYFCKACKRCWTQGGTLRNIPIGGRRSRRGNCSKSSSSSTINSFQPQMEPQPQLQVQPEMQVQLQSQSTSPYYQGSGVGGGGYSSSLVAVHSLNPSPQPFNQSLNVRVGDVVASSDSGILSGFNTAASLGSQHNHHSQICLPQFNQIGHGEREVESMLRAEQGYHITPNMANSNVAYHFDHWPQSIVSDANHRTSDHASLWSTISTTSSSGNTQNHIGFGSSSLMQWPNLPGYGSHQ